MSQVMYHLYIYGKWQHGISRLELAESSAQELANRKRRFVDLFRRVGKDADSDEFLKTVYPDGLDKQFEEFKKAA